MRETRLGNNLPNTLFQTLSNHRAFSVNREMLDGAQRMISELKSDPSKKTKSGSEAARSREVQSMNLFHCMLKYETYFLLLFE